MKFTLCRPVSFAPTAVAISATCLVGALSSGCLVDNQRLTPADWNLVVNPNATNQNARESNAAHRVLVAVIDSGVDYNHPLLSKNVHYRLNDSGQPVGAGWDFLGEDFWPAPFLARTAVFDTTLGDDKRKAASAHMDLTASLIALAPDLASVLEPRRIVTTELSETTVHGTHVAGLTSYDRTDIGILPYRVLPTQRSSDTSDDHDYNAETISHIARAVDRAAADGARVINLSLGLDFIDAKNPGESGSKENKAAYEEFLRNKAQRALLKEVLDRNSHVLFVAAAGNEKDWRDEKNRLGMPCGIQAPNMLCVGALREDGEPTDFTTLQLSGVDFVFALGEQVLSTIPPQMCYADSLAALRNFNAGTSQEDRLKFIETLRKDCNAAPGPMLAAMNGTSMAAPLVARQAAIILSDSPALTPAQVIRKIYRLAVPSFIGIVPVYKLKLPKPSWYLGYADILRANKPKASQLLQLGEPFGDPQGSYSSLQSGLPFYDRFSAREGSSLDDQTFEGFTYRERKK